MSDDDVITIQLLGIDELKANLAAIPHKLRRRALLKALKAAAVPVRDLAVRYRRANPSTARMGPWRRHGTVAAAIMVRVSKVATKQGDVGVFVNVKPLPPGQRHLELNGRSVTNPLDPFYWRFLEFGTKHSEAKPFLVPAVAALGESLNVFTREIGPIIEKLNVDPKDPL